MKFPLILFALSLALCGVIVAAFVIPEVPFVDEEIDGVTQRTYLGHGFEHPDFETMQASVPGAERHPPILWLGLIFGLIQIAFFVTALAFGSEKNGSLGPLAKPFIGFGIVYAAIFTMMILSYRTYMTEETHTLFLALPKPTAWMIYGVWGAPIAFMFLFMFTFDRWTFTEADAKRFEELLAARGTEAQDS